MSSISSVTHIFGKSLATILVPLEGSKVLTEGNSEHRGRALPGKGLRGLIHKEGFLPYSYQYQICDTKYFFFKCLASIMALLVGVKSQDIHIQGHCEQGTKGGNG